MKNESSNTLPVKNNVFRRVSFLLYEKFVKPKSSDEDVFRREFLINILLLASIALSGVLYLIVIFQWLKLGAAYKGLAMSTMSLVFFGFVILYLLSRAKFFILASYIFLIISYLVTTYTAFHWGADVPQVLLGYAFVIIVSGVLIGTLFAFEVAFFIALAIIFITYLHSSGLVLPQVYWKAGVISLKDAFQFSITLITIAVVSWLSNREIERSLKRARRSEEELREERDSLEIRIQERTKELQKIQVEKMSQTAKFIEFGKISSGLFHDLVNRMNFLFFSIEKANDAGEKKLSKAREHIKKANEARESLTQYIRAVRLQLQNQKTESNFLISDEILEITKIFDHRFKMSKVKFEMKGDLTLRYFGSAARFNQIIANIILNALDAYENAGYEKGKIHILIEVVEKAIRISVQDWAGGIPLMIQEKIFDPFFTTKAPHKGTGIGLATAKSIVEEDLEGKIYFESAWGEGTKFIIEFPIRYETKQV